MARGRGQAASDRLLANSVFRSVGRGRPAEGQIPFSSVRSKALRAQSVSGGPATREGLPTILPGSPISRAAITFARQSLRSAAGGRGQDSGPASGVGGGQTAGVRTVRGLSAADRAVTLGIPGLPGLAAGGFALANRLFGPTTGVLGPIAPRVGTQAFRDTVDAGRNSGFGRSPGPSGFGGPGGRPSGPRGGLF